MADAAKQAKIEATARILANVLLTEMQFPVDMKPQHKQQALKVWYAIPPLRTELRFQTQDVGNPDLKDTAKAAAAVPIADQQKPEDMEELFCPVHGGFVLISGADIEHGMPFAQIRERQQQLLDFLNESANQALADEFLKQEVGDQKISDFFRRDGKSGKIHMSRYFALMCYNNISNLWLICHACNIRKVNKDSMAWFAEQRYFGAEFVAAVGRQGGLHRGLIFDQVGGVQKETVTIGGKSVEIYQGGTGIGQYAINWFRENKKELMDAFRQFHNEPEHTFRNLMVKLNEALKAGNPKLVRLTRRETKLKIGFANAVFDEALSLHSDSESDSSSQEEAQRSRVTRAAIDTKRNTSLLKKMKKMLKVHYKIEGVNEDAIDTFFTAHTATLIGVTSTEYMEKLLKDIKEQIEQTVAAVSSITWAEMQAYINQSIDDEVHRAKRAEAAEQRAEVERQQKEVERQQRLAAEQQRDAERQANILLQQRIMEFQAQSMANQPRAQQPVVFSDLSSSPSLLSRAESKRVKRAEPDNPEESQDRPQKPTP